MLSIAPRNRHVNLIGKRAQRKLPPKSVEQLIYGQSSASLDAPLYISPRVIVLCFSLVLTGLELQFNMTSFFSIGLFSAIVFSLQGGCLVYFSLDLYWNSLQSQSLALLDVFHVVYLLRCYLHSLVLFRSPQNYATVVSTFLRTVRVLSPLFLSSAEATLPVKLRRLFRGFSGSMRTIFWLMFLICLLLYFWAVLLTVLIGHEAGPQWLERPQYTATLSRSMFSCFQMLTLDHWAVSIVRPMSEGTMGVVSLLLLYCVAFAGMRIIVGVVVEQVTSSARVQLKESDEFVSQIEESLVITLEDEMTDAIGGEDEIDCTQLRRVLLRKNVLAKLAALEIAPTTVEELHKTLVSANFRQTTSIKRLVSLLTQTRGEASNTRLVSIQLRIAAAGQRAKTATGRIAHLAATVDLTQDAIEQWYALFQDNKLKYTAKQMAVVFNKKRTASREAIVKQTERGRGGASSLSRPSSALP